MDAVERMLRILELDSNILKKRRDEFVRQLFRVIDEMGDQHRERFQAYLMRGGSPQEKQQFGQITELLA